MPSHKQDTVKHSTPSGMKGLLRGCTAERARSKVGESVATPRGFPQQQSDTTKDVYNVIKQQTDIIEMLVKHQNLTRLPQRDIPGKDSEESQIYRHVDRQAKIITDALFGSTRAC